MTYCKKCRKKGKAIVSIALSLAMLGTSTAPTINLLGNEISSVYADEANSNENNLWKIIRVAHSIGDNQGVKFAIYYKQDTEVKKYYDMIDKVVINGDEFKFEEFKGYSAAYDFASKSNNVEKHDLAWEKSTDGNKVKIALVLKNGDKHVLLVDKESCNYDAEKDSSIIKAGSPTVSPKEKQREDNTAKKGDSTQKTENKKNIDEKAIDSVIIRKVGEEGSEYEAVKLVFKYRIDKKVLEKYQTEAKSITINGEEFSIDQFKLHLGDFISNIDNAEKHRGAFNRGDSKHLVILTLKDGSQVIWKSEAYKVAEELGKAPKYDNIDDTKGSTEKKEQDDKKGHDGDLSSNATGYKSGKTVYTKQGKDRSLDTSVYAIRPLDTDKSKGVTIDMYSVAMDHNLENYKNVVFSRIDEITVDGKTIKNKGTIKQIDDIVNEENWEIRYDPRFSLLKHDHHDAENSVLRGFSIADEELLKAYNETERQNKNHKFEIKFVDGSTLKYESRDKKKEGQTWADFFKDAIQIAKKHGDSIIINLKGHDAKSDDDIQEHRSLVYGLAPHIKQVIINGHTVHADMFLKNSGGNDFMNMPNGKDDPIIKNWNSELGANNKVEFFLDDNSSITWSDKVKEEKEAELPQEDAKELEGLKKISIADLEKAKDGKYTIGFEARYADGRKGTSMLQGFFDRNIEVEKRGDKITARFLNLFFADGLLDFRIKNIDNTWPEESKKEFVDPSTKKQAYFTMNIKDLTEVHEGAVLVSYMGGKLSDKGMMDTKYTKVKILFKKDAYEGWKGFHEIYDLKEKHKLGPEILKKRLRFSGLDKDNDGNISVDELKNAPVMVDLTWRGAPLETQYNKIYDIAELKDLGPNVKVIKLSSNGLTSLPKGVFDNAVNLEEIYLNGNRISEIPSDIFKNNKKLKKVSLASNPIAVLDKDLFANNPEITDIDLGNTNISEVKEETFKNLKKLRNLDLSANDLSILNDDVFKENTELRSLEITDNAITKLPSSLSKASKLEKLALGNNRLTSLPDYVGEFANLKYLDLKFNNIADINDTIWNNLAKRDGLKIDLMHNNLTKLPGLSDVKFESLKVASNNLPAEMPDSYASLKISKDEVGGYYSQRSSVDYSMDAKNGKINFAVKGDMNILDLLNWNEVVNFEKKNIFTVKEYREYTDKLLRKNNGEFDSLAEKLKKDRDFKVETRVERVYEDGSTKTLLEKEDLNALGETSGSAYDKRMENNGKYRLTQQLFVLIGGEWVKNYEVNKEVTATVDANTNPGSGSHENDNTKKVLKYTLPVNLMKYDNRSENSMGADAMDKTVEVEETSKGVKLTLSFHSMEYVLADKKRTGHLQRMGVYDTVDEATGNDYVPATIVSKYKDAGNEFPGKVSFTRPKRGEKEIAVRVWVDAMDAIAKETGNANKDASQPAILRIDWSNAPKESLIGKEEGNKTENNDKNEDSVSKKALLKNSIKMAEKMLKSGLVEGRSKEILEKALENARNIYNSDKKSSFQSANDIIMFAMDNVKKETDTLKTAQTSKDTLDIKKLDKEIADKEVKKGAKLYSVPVVLWHATDAKESMGNGAIVKTAIVSEKDGKYKYYVDFNGMPFFGMYGHLWDLKIYENGLGSSKTPATVEKTKMDKDLTGKMREFPSRFSFTRNSKDREIFAEVSVDAMDSMKNKAETYEKIVKGSGKQNAKFLFDWSLAKEYKDGVVDKTLTTGGRLAGADRYETSAKISQKYFDKADTVVLASGKNNVDALVSASYADAKKAPILLSTFSDVPASVKAEILRLGAKNVVIVGGNASISVKAENDLKAMGLSIKRIAGANRYETSAILAQNVKDMTGSDKLILITGVNNKEADALTVSSLATKSQIPVMMTKANELDSNARAKINSWKPSQVIVVGGQATISDRVMGQINVNSKTRVAGATRFETAAKIAKQAYPNANHVFVTNGYKAVDALAAGAVTAKAKSPILLVGNNSVINEVKDITSGKKLTVLGGTSTVSENVVNKLK